MTGRWLQLGSRSAATSAASCSPARCIADAFALARIHGAARSSLSTDSRTGALTLYERVGMVVSSTWVNRAMSL